MLLGWEYIVIGEAEVTYVFKSVGVSFRVILEEVACNSLILSFLRATSHFVFV